MNSYLIRDFTVLNIKFEPITRLKTAKFPISIMNSYMRRKFHGVPRPSVPVRYFSKYFCASIKYMTKMAWLALRSYAFCTTASVSYGCASFLSCVVDIGGGESLVLRPNCGSRQPCGLATFFSLTSPKHQNAHCEPRRCQKKNFTCQLILT